MLLFYFLCINKTAVSGNKKSKNIDVFSISNNVDNAGKWPATNRKHDKGRVLDSAFIMMFF